MFKLNRINVADRYVKSITNTCLDALSEYNCFFKYSHSSEFNNDIRNMCYNVQKAVIIDMRCKTHNQVELHD